MLEYGDSLECSMEDFADLLNKFLIMKGVEKASIIY